MAKAAKLTEPVRAREMTEARMGPTQGVHNNPNPSPRIKPPPKPLLLVVGRWGKRAKSFSINA